MKRFAHQFTAAIMLLGGSALLLAITGCQPTWHSDAGRYIHAYEDGNYPVAMAESSSLAQDGVPTDQLLFRLDEGAIFRDAGQLPQSTQAFEAADKLVGDYQQWPQVRLSEEFAAAITSARNVNYRGSLADLVMLNVYRSLNDMETGDLSSARVHLIRAQFVQQDIAHHYADELRNADRQSRDQNASSDTRTDVDQSLNAPGQSGSSLKNQLDHGGDIYPQPSHTYGAYVNPFCDFVQGLFFASTALDASDRERAVSTFRRAAGMERGNPYLRQAAASAANLANNAPPGPVTYVIFETGLSPVRGQIQIPLPLFIFSNVAPTVVLYIPTIQPIGDFVRGFTATAGGRVYESSLVCDMDAVNIQDFKNELPTIVTRMIIAAATKAAIDAGVKQALRNQDPLAQLGFDILSTGYQLIMNQADLRSWRTLPKQFSIVRFPTPAEGSLTLNYSDGSPSMLVNLSPGPTTVVYVKSIRRGVPITLRQFTLSSTRAF